MSAAWSTSEELLLWVEENGWGNGNFVEAFQPSGVVLLDQKVVQFFVLCPMYTVRTH